MEGVFCNRVATIRLLSVSLAVFLSSQAFFSLSFLEKLDLSWNQLTFLPVDFSASLSALRELRLEHNNLQHLSEYRYLSVCWSSKCNQKYISSTILHIPASLLQLLRSGTDG